MASSNLTVDWMFALSRKDEPNSSIVKLLKPRPEPQNPQQIQIILEKMYDTKLNTLDLSPPTKGMEVQSRSRP